jgi:phosphate acyltransferase
MKIVLDAMGGDYAPGIPVQAALLALDELGSDLELILTGPEKRLRAELKTLGREGEQRLEIVNADEVIDMSDKAARAIRQKKDSSLYRAIELHKDGRADGIVSAGHTGAQMAASFMLLGLIEGVRRPTIGSLFPVGGGKFSFLTDVGANTDCKAVHLLEFGVMGSIFMEIFAGKTNPSVALISIGEEKTKGNEVVLAAHYLFEQSGLNFIGNVEGGDILAGKADVYVCDGFTGNILLKFAESVGSRLLRQFSDALQDNSELSQHLIQAQKSMDYSEIGGVPLLGVNGISVICHGRSSAKALKNAIREAMILKRGNLAAALAKGVAKYDASMFTRGMARFRSFQERRDQLEINGDTDQ